MRNNEGSCPERLAVACVAILLTSSEWLFDSTPSYSRPPEPQDGGVR